MKFNNKTLFELLTLIGFFAIIWWLFSTVLLPRQQFNQINQISIEKEKHLGEFMSDFFEKGFKKVEDSLMLSSVNHIMERLLSGIDSTAYEYKLTILDSDEINAFALPGGNIYVFSGLVNFTENPEELASVLAHEIGHIEHRHIISRVISDLGIATISGLLSGDVFIFREVLNKIMSRGFYRYQELEADDFALNLMTKCGINPRHKGVLFSRLNDKFDDDIDIPNIFNTHPGHDTRLKAAFSYELPEDFIEIPIDVVWEFKE